MSDTPGKKVKVAQVLKLAEGLEATLHDFQISASNEQGEITMVDMQLVTDEDKEFVEYKLQPGCWRITPKSGMQKWEIPAETFIKTDASRKLMRHFTTLFNKPEVYEKYKQPQIRKILLGSEPGIGKSATIREFCRSLLHETETCILRIDSAEVSWEVMTQMFMKATKADVAKVVLIVEDIGGTALDDRRHNIQSDLLNFLAGNTDIFKVPTLVVGTTNYINQVGAALNDRPGRFDVVMQLAPQSDADTLLIMEPILGRAMTEEEQRALLGHKFTPAYCLEAIIRAELFEISIAESVAELLEQRKKSQKGSHGSQARGSFGFED